MSMSMSVLSASGVVGDDGMLICSVTVQEACLVGRFLAIGDDVGCASVERITVTENGGEVDIVAMEVSVYDLMSCPPPYQMVLLPGSTISFRLLNGKPGGEYKLGFVVSGVR